jgi:hypothetical protein
MINAVQAALDDAGIDDTIRAVGQLEPRGTVGGLFAGGFIGDELGGSVGGAVGAIAGMHAGAAASGMPREMLVGASDSTIYGFKMHGGRRGEPELLLFRVPRAGLEVKVHSRVNVRVLELIEPQSGSKIELEGNRLPITHSKDLIEFVAGK